MTSLASALAVTRTTGMNGSEGSALGRLTVVEPRHHHIEQDEVRQELADLFERLDAVPRRRHLVALRLEPHLQDVDIVRDIVDDQDQRRITHHPPQKVFHRSGRRGRAVGAANYRPEH